MSVEPRPKRRWKAVSIALLLIAAAFVMGRMSVEHAGHETADHAVDAKPGSVLEYTCSMHPQIRSINPTDKCPICGMDLIPVPKDDDDMDDGDMPVLRVSERAAAIMEIQTQPAERRVVEMSIRLFGKVDFDETRLAEIVARSDGYIEKLHANYAWQTVRRGEVVAEIYSPAVVTSMRELLVARDGSAGLLDGARARLIRMGVEQEEIDEVLKGGDVPRTYRVRSPYDGVVRMIDVREGDSVMEGARIIRIADVSNLWINLEAYETDLSWLRTGQSVRFNVAALPGEAFEGDIVYIEPVVNDRTRTVRLRAEAPNPDDKLRPGMFVTGHAQSSMDEESIVIPATAPLITGRRALVYVRMPGGERPTFEPRAIVLGPRAGDHYVVREGLREGDLVVVHGQFKIDSELQIRGRSSMMQPEGGRPPAGHDHGGPAVVDLQWPVIGERDMPEDLIPVLVNLSGVYLALQDALSRDSADQAARIASAASFPALPENTPEWSNSMNAMVHSVAVIALQTDIGEMRKEFRTLSGLLIPVLPFLPPGEEVLYIMHCPMASDNTGADWAQVDEDIRNPYFGASMLRCGEVKRRL